MGDCTAEWKEIEALVDRGFLDLADDEAPAMNRFAAVLDAQQVTPETTVREFEIYAPGLTIYAKLQEKLEREVMASWRDEDSPAVIAATRLVGACDRWRKRWGRLRP